MPLLLLLLLIFTCQMEGWHHLFDWQTPSLCAALTGVAMASVVLFAWLIARWTRWGLYRFPEERETVLARYGTLRFIHFVGLFLVFAVALFLFGWGWAVKPIEEPAAPGVELLLLAPFLAAMVLSWCCFYDSERAIHDTLHPLITAGRPFWSRKEYVGFHVRQNLAMVLVPILLLIFLQGVDRLDPEYSQSPGFKVFSAGLLIGMFLCMPLVLRVMLGLRSLGPGELRDRLEAAARRLNFRCRDILVWNTRQGVANALVVGPVPWLRYVVFTDRLLTDLTSEEVEAVFGHEMGHIKHHHMLFYFGFLLISLAVLVGLWEQMAPQFGLMHVLGKEWTAPMVVASLLVYIFVVFGFLSRRCERQADIYGCRAVSCNQADCQEHSDAAVAQTRGQTLCPTGIKTFIQALEKVAILNGISRNRPGWLQSWQHSTIANRVEFLQRMLIDPAIEPHFQRHVRLVKWMLMIALCTLLGILSWSLGQRSEDPQVDRQASGQAVDLDRVNR